LGVTRDVAADANVPTPEATKQPLASGRRALILHLFVVTLILAIGLGLIWFAFSTKITSQEDYDRVINTVAKWQPVSQWLFLIGLALLFSRVTRYTALYPLTVFLVSFEPVFELVNQGIASSSQSLAPTLDAVIAGATPQTFTVGLLGIYTIVFAVITAVIRPSLADYGTVGATSRVDAGRTLRPKAMRAADDYRRRIKTYFSPRPIWPIVASVVGTALALFGMVGVPQALESLYVQWITSLFALFSLAALALLPGDKKRGPTYYLYLFVAIALMGSVVINQLTGYPYTVRVRLIQQDDVDGLISYYRWYWTIAGAVLIAYALLFRYLIYRRWHLATDAQIDACIADDLRSLLPRAMSRMGIDQSGLIAQPLTLRSFPDRSAITNAFYGSRIGDDDKLRFTPQSATVIAFTAEQTLYYEMTVDLTTGAVLNEVNVEFFYQDVSNVARTSSTNVVELKSMSMMLGWLRNLFSRSTAARQRELKERSINDALMLPGRDVFQINLDSGRALVVILRDNTFFDTKRKRIVSVLTGTASGGATRPDLDLALPVDENERVMRNIRSMLRDKKRALLMDRDAD